MRSRGVRRVRVRRGGGHVMLGHNGGMGVSRRRSRRGGGGVMRPAVCGGPMGNPNCGGRRSRRGGVRPQLGLPIGPPPPALEMSHRPRGGGAPEVRPAVCGEVGWGC